MSNKLFWGRFVYLLYFAFIGIAVFITLLLVAYGLAWLWIEESSTGLIATAIVVLVVGAFGKAANEMFKGKLDEVEPALSSNKQTTQETQKQIKIKEK